MSWLSFVSIQGFVTFNKFASIPGYRHLAATPHTANRYAQFLNLMLTDEKNLDN
jgi:hypothetical protein